MRKDVLLDALPDDTIDRLLKLAQWARLGWIRVRYRRVVVVDRAQLANLVG
ncbi:hypothetical protein [Halomonas urumqiensis]|uniref:hypothetical protein n=1 Tax=Halomonas urumqiensis TaxID=1684789 RepID=UPI0015E10204|nr:hypothetical protein [Halomonas urumqiensis]GHE21692.1 hypothetical protein GCM10017767_22130 [Halomonas urumqiensis]